MTAQGGTRSKRLASVRHRLPRRNRRVAQSTTRGFVVRERRSTLWSRLVERVGVAAYRMAGAMLGRLPEGPAAHVLGWVTQATYLLWPGRRRRANLNFGHVLGLPPDDPAVRALALAAYRNYARYLVELMRLPRIPLEVAAQRVEPHGIETVMEAWREAGSLILAVAHVGNNEYVAAGLASRGWPVSVLADDTGFPEMFELLRRERERWGVRIIPWRNIREIYGVLRRGEMLGLLVDWGYRPDGIPVRLFDAWTTLPAGPAVLAAKTGATILPVVVRRRPDGTFLVTHDEPIRVASSAPADLKQATQAIADALERTIAAAPEQWYSFKSMWPEPAEAQAAAPADLMPGAPHGLPQAVVEVVSGGEGA